MTRLIVTAVLAALLLGGCATSPWPELEAGQDDLQAAFPPPEGWVSEEGRIRVGARCPYECPSIQQRFTPPDGEVVTGEMFDELCEETLAALEESERFRWTGQEFEPLVPHSCQLSIRVRGRDAGLPYGLTVDAETPGVVYLVG